MNNRFLQMSFCVFLGAAAAGCATKASRPSADLAVAGIALAGSALENAELAGARKHAPVQLRIAREKKAAADKAINENDFEKAQYLSVEARADAELARAASDAEKARKELARAQDKIQVLEPEALPVNLNDSHEEHPLE